MKGKGRVKKKKKKNNIYIYIYIYIYILRRNHIRKERNRRKKTDIIHAK